LAVLDHDIDAIIRTHGRDRKVAAWLQDTAEALEEIGEIDLALDWAKRARPCPGSPRDPSSSPRWTTSSPTLATPIAADHDFSRSSTAAACPHTAERDAMFALYVRHQLRPDAVDDFDRLVERTVASVRAHEPHTLVYLAGAPEGDPLARVFLEVYRDDEAFARHNGQPYVQQFLAAREPMLSELRVEFVPECDGAMPAAAGLSRSAPPERR
jgi:quinol monooxygenase YgiN